MKMNSSLPTIKIIGIGPINLDVLARYIETNTRTTEVLLNIVKEGNVTDRNGLKKLFYAAVPYRLVTVCAGGSAFNTIAALKNIDPAINVHYISLMGKDEEALAIKQDPNWAKVDTKFVQEGETETGMCVSIVRGPGLERLSRISPAIDLEWHPTNCDLSVFHGANWVHISPFAVEEYNWDIVQLLRKVKSVYGTKVIVSLDPGVTLSRKELCSSLVEALLENVDYLILNHNELLTLLGINLVRSQETHMAAMIKEAFRNYSFLNSIIVERDYHKFFVHRKDREEVIQTAIPYITDKTKRIVFNDTGAGDIFNAAFIYCKLTKRSFMQNALLAADAIGLHLQHFGTCSYEAFKWAGPTFFFLHSSHDKAFVEELVEKLKTADLGVWLCSQETKPGDDLVQNIQQRIRDCDEFIVCASPETILSDWVSKEVQWLQELKISNSFNVKIIIAIIKKIEYQLLRKIEEFEYVDLSGDPYENILILVREAKKRLESVQGKCQCKLLTEW